MSATHLTSRRFSDIVGAGDADPRRWLILAVICAGVLMIVLDTTVMNLALPSAQHALGFTNADRQWIVTAYSLSFGSLLLFCGRLADLIGRKVTFLAGLRRLRRRLRGRRRLGQLHHAGDGTGLPGSLRRAAGAVGPVAADQHIHRSEGTGQGVRRLRHGRGQRLSHRLLLGGALTSYLSWRWCLYINLVFAAIALPAGALLLGRQPRTPGARLDVPGVAAVSGGMFCLVYGFSNAAVHGWHTPSTWSFLVTGAVLLIVFAAWQTRAAHPLLPPGSSWTATAAAPTSPASPTAQAYSASSCSSSTTCR